MPGDFDRYSQDRWREDLRCLIEGDSTEEFKVLVSASRLAEILKRSDCGQVEFIIEDKVLAVVAGGARCGVYRVAAQHCQPG